MPLYRVTPGNGNRTDLNQLIDALTGQNDTGAIQAYAQISTPSALTAAINTTSGNLTGAYQYKVAHLTGYWQGPTGTGTLYTQGNTGGGTTSNTVSPSAQQINQSAIPIGPIGTVARAIYRTKANGSTFYFVTQISDNVTTAWTDNVADTALVTVMPTTNTTGSYFSGDGHGLTNLPPATVSFAGAVKVGSNITVAADGTISIPSYPWSGITGTPTTLPSYGVALSGDVTNSGNAVTLANSGVAAGTYPKVTVDAKGRVTVGAALVAADIPSLDWSKIGTGKPTSISGYAISDNIVSSITAGTNIAVTNPTGLGAASVGITGIIPIANGGTGSATQNFVDLITVQTIGGTKTFSSDVTFSGVLNATGARINLVNGTTPAEKRHHLYNGGGVAEWLFGQKSGTSHDFIFSKLVGSTETDYFRVSTSGGMYSLNNTLDDGNGFARFFTATSDDTNGIFRVENTSIGAGAATNSQIMARSKYGSAQFMKYADQGLRMGMRATANGDTGAVQFTYGNDAVGITLDGSGNTTFAGSITAGAGGSFASSLATSGYQKLPGGFIRQWGTVSAAAAGTAVTFPIVFPTACVGIKLTASSNLGNATATSFPLSATGTTIYDSRAGGGVIYWEAIGY
jgi:hypothetical protein